MKAKSLDFFTLVEKLLTALVGQLPTYQKAPKPWVARELLRLFDAVGEAHRDLTELSHWIHKGETAQTREGKVYFLFEGGKILDRLAETCVKFLPWGRDRLQVFDALKLVAPEIEGLDDIETDALTFREIIVEKQLNRTRRAFQTVPHPDPARLPSSEMLQELQIRLQSLSAQCAEALETLRGFATAELKVEDFFQG